MAAKDQELRKKRAEISTWLSQVLNNESIPDFEMNAQTIQLLHQLSVTNQHKERNAQLYVEDLKKKTEEYNADAQRVGSILDRLTLNQNNFSKSGLACQQALARTGAALGVKDASDTSYMLSLQELHSSVNEVTRKLQTINQDTSKDSRKTHDILMKQSSLQKALDVFENRSSQEAAQIAGRKKEISILRKATGENETKIEKLKTELGKSGVSDSFSHDKLVNKKEMLDGLENELAPLKAELNSFSSLPPDPVEAKVKIEQLKRELSNLQVQMSECVDVAMI